jgi:hypothetical protein
MRVNVEERHFSDAAGNYILGSGSQDFINNGAGAVIAKFK